MRLNSFPFITFLCVLLTACGMSCAFSTKVKPKQDKVYVSERAQTIDIGMEPNREYVIKERIDLKGKQLNVPIGVTITFKKGGAFINGKLNGNGTKLNSKTNNVIGVTLKGTWCVDKVSDLVFSKDYLSDTEIINNLNVIQSDTMTNEVTINSDYLIAISKSGGAALRPSSHSKILLKGTLSLESNDYKSYQIIDIRGKEDVTINGGCIVGDIGNHTYIEGTSSEWGMGINVMQSRDVSLSDIRITKCTGDGIYISGGNEPSVGIYDQASKNITIRRITCDSNRRQGLSIIHVDGLVVRDCSFFNTGRIELIPPGAGIDIEPNVSNGCNMSVRNVVIDNCIIKNNVGMAVATNNTYENGDLRNYQNILFSNCQTDGLLKAQSDDVTFRNCSFKEINFASVYAPTHISFEKCTISGGYGISLYAPSVAGVHSKDRLLALDFKECVISTAEDNVESEALISCYKSYIDNLEYVSFVDCQFIIPEKKIGEYSFTDYSFKGKLSIKNSLIQMDGHKFSAVGMELSNNKIQCRVAEQLPMRSSNRVITSD